MQIEPARCRRWMGRRPRAWPSYAVAELLAFALEISHQMRFRGASPAAVEVVNPAYLIRSDDRLFSARARLVHATAFSSDLSRAFVDEAARHLPPTIRGAMTRGSTSWNLAEWWFFELPMNVCEERLMVSASPNLAVLLSSSRPARTVGRNDTPRRTASIECGRRLARSDHLPDHDGPFRKRRSQQRLRRRAALIVALSRR